MNSRGVVKLWVAAVCIGACGVGVLVGVGTNATGTGVLVGAIGVSATAGAGISWWMRVGAGSVFPMILSNILFVTTGVGATWATGVGATTGSGLITGIGWLAIIGWTGVVMIIGSIEATVGIDTASTTGDAVGIAGIGVIGVGIIIEELTDSTIIGASWEDAVSIIGDTTSVSGVDGLMRIELVSASACTVGIGLGAFSFSIERASDSGQKTVSSEDFWMNIVPVVACWAWPPPWDPVWPPPWLDMLLPRGSLGGVEFTGFLSISSKSHIREKVKNMI